MLLTASALSARSLPIGLLSAAPAQQNDLPLVYSCSVCSACGARGNAFCQLEGNRWSCVICQQWNALESTKTREFTYSAFSTSLQEGTRSRKTHHAFVVLDETLPSSERFAVRDAIAEAINELPDDMYLGLITFSSAVKIYELGSMGNRIGCEVFSGLASPSSEDIREISHHDNAASGLESFVAPLHVCRGMVFKVLNFLAEQTAKRENPSRCLGPAIEYALVLSKVCDASSASVIIGADSVGNVGPGAWKVVADTASAEVKQLAERDRNRCLEYYRILSAMARETHSSVDVFLSGTGASLGAKPLLELTSNVFLQSMACSKTLAIGLRGDSAPLQTIHVAVSAPQRLSIVHVAGASITNEGRAVWFEARGKPALFFDNRAPSQSEPVFVQCVARREFADREVVVTEKLTFARPFTVMNGDAIAALVAKRSCIIAQSNNQDVMLARHHVENELYNVSRLVGESILDQAEFDKLAVLLFHFYRGPLLGGPGSQYSNEDLDCLQARFLNNTSLEEAILMMAPSLTGFRWGRVANSSSHAKQTLEVASISKRPLTTLSLESDYCLVLDQLTDVFVWFGAEVPAEAKERSMALAHAKALACSVGRYPISRVVVFEEQSPKARWLRCRLSPEHRDVAVTAGSEEVRRLMSKLCTLPSDEMTYKAFLQLALGGGTDFDGTRKQQHMRADKSSDERLYRLV